MRGTSEMSCSTRGQVGGGSFAAGLFRCAIVGVVLLTPRVSAAEPLSNDPWQRVLEAYVSGSGIEYRALEADRGDLDEFLRSASHADLGDRSREDQTAFWINVYNAAVLHFVLEQYPDVESVMDVEGFFDRRRIPVAGVPMTLDEIEDRAMEDGDPRIHFALVCAARSCPDLRPEPYDGQRLRSQLGEQTRDFLSDTERGAKLDSDGKTLWVSTLFKWYGGDFTGGNDALAYLDRGRIVEWLLPYLPAETAASVQSTGPRVRYLEYDWVLNDRSGLPR
jgi:hypothetical protein